MKKSVRTWIAAGALVAVVASVDVASGAAIGTQVSCLNARARTTSASTTSTAWVNVPGMNITVTLAQNFAVQVSGTFAGAAARFRVEDTTIGGTFAVDPGTTSLTPRSGIAEPFSFTWEGTNPAEHSHTFALQWKRFSAGTVTLKTGAMTVLYQGAPTLADC